MVVQFQECGKWVDEKGPAKAFLTICDETWNRQKFKGMTAAGRERVAGRMDAQKRRPRWASTTMILFEVLILEGPAKTCHGLGLPAYIGVEVQQCLLPVPNFCVRGQKELQLRIAIGRE